MYACSRACPLKVNINSLFQFSHTPYVPGAIQKRCVCWEGASSSLGRSAAHVCVHPVS